MTDYSKLSDFEINMAIAEVIFPDCKVIESKSRPPYACVISHLPSKWVDYCNNPADAWPIILKNGISLLNHWDPDGDDSISSIWSATTNIDKTWCDPRINGCESTHENPLRAAMIVFLQMQENKQ